MDACRKHLRIWARTTWDTSRGSQVPQIQEWASSRKLIHFAQHLTKIYACTHVGNTLGLGPVPHGIPRTCPRYHHHFCQTCSNTLLVLPVVSCVQIGLDRSPSVCRCLLHRHRIVRNRTPKLAQWRILDPKQHADTVGGYGTVGVGRVGWYFRGVHTTTGYMKDAYMAPCICGPGPKTNCDGRGPGSKCVFRPLVPITSRFCARAGPINIPFGDNSRDSQAPRCPQNELWWGRPGLQWRLSALVVRAVPITIIFGAAPGPSQFTWWPLELTFDVALHLLWVTEDIGWYYGFKSEKEEM